MSKPILAKWTRADLPNEGLRLLSDAIGINNVKAIMVKLPGKTIHIPKTFYRQSDDSYLNKHKDLPVEVLAHKTGLSIRTIYRRLKSVR